ncbi:TrmH family RNA methyltransferase [Blastopirellula marina]|uniref:RNA methyltransferase n=1 Tax=Blastopirellula marina TaxID=124 RepID=A0A2S8G0N6_9BACT|nr:RNA methyltransferase [Blastopirellula marina]PQO37996.1 RNA methyltransferase [Blastopirellula marina]PTL44652.1 RNA methyltransferase [Blastopirellula marina]
MSENIISIDSPADPQLLRYQREFERKSHMRDGYFVAESQFLVQRLLDSDFLIESILVDGVEKIPQLPPQRQGTFPIYVLSRADIKQLVGYNFHRGIMACGKRPARASIEQALPAAMPGNATVLAASKIGDFENLGAIIRTACAFGADAILLDDGCADPFSRRSLRVSTGHAFKIPIVESADFAADLAKLKSLGFESFATVLSESATPLAEVTRAQRSVLLMGNEGYGLEDDTLARCDHQITLPMQRGSDSLNVAMATGIFLYHFCYLQA